MPCHGMVIHCCWYIEHALAADKDKGKPGSQEKSSLYRKRKIVTLSVSHDDPLSPKSHKNQCTLNVQGHVFLDQEFIEISTDMRGLTHLYILYLWILEKRIIFFSRELSLSINHISILLDARMPLIFWALCHHHSHHVCTCCPLDGVWMDHEIDTWTSSMTMRAECIFVESILFPSLFHGRFHGEELMHRFLLIFSVALKGRNEGDFFPYVDVRIKLWGVIDCLSHAQVQLKEKEVLAWCGCEISLSPFKVWISAEQSWYYTCGEASSSSSDCCIDFLCVYLVCEKSVNV